jgi:glucose-6-phosphate isomerase
MSDRTHRHSAERLRLPPYAGYKKQFCCDEGNNTMSTLTQSPAWQALQTHHQSMTPVHMRDLFARDPQRFQTFSLEACGLLLDYSKNRVTEESMALLTDLARQAQVEERRAQMFAGEKINITEDRAVLHVALRNRANTPIQVDGQDVMPLVNAVLEQMRGFTREVREGTWRGYTGKRITDVVNIGIGGSDLGPRLVCDALAHNADGPRVHFLVNVDPTARQQVLAQVAAHARDVHGIEEVPDEVVAQAIAAIRSEDR